MTDNGTSGSGFNAGMRERKGSQYDGGHRVPCFLRWPGKLEAGRDVDRLTAHIDLTPTLLDLCGVAAPQGVRFDGRSIRPLLTGAADWPDRTLFVQSHRIEHPEPWRKSAVMTERYRLVDGKELYDIVSDPGQTSDIAGQEPEVVRRLRGAYEEWYADVSARFDEYCPIVLGAPQQNPTTLTCHDWHGPEVPWNHGHIRRRLVANGFWAVEVARGGRYRITLRERPAVADFPMKPGAARLKIGNIDVTRPVQEGSRGTVFLVDLEAGQDRLETWITEDGGPTRGAYFVEVEYLAGQ
jgi:hypothetical protein